MNRPLCFVLMPFGKKYDAAGKLIDFDAVYKDFIAPAIAEAELEPIRADEEIAGGIIHKPMFERLILCDYAVADLSTANANVFYELGVRHAVKPFSTVIIFSEADRLPFDVRPLRGMPYKINAEGVPAEPQKVKESLAQSLKDAREKMTDSPIFQLLDGYPNIDHTRTDIFRDQVNYSIQMKEKLAEAESQGLEALLEIKKELGALDDSESGIVIDLFLSFRAVKAWQQMIDLVDEMSAPLAATILVQEQLGLALNRNGEGEKAERVLTNLIKQRGSSSETYGILGRVYKDRWATAEKAGKTLLAKGLLDSAIDAYLKGFEADWRDAYPGINAVTLMEIKNPPDPRREKLIPVVSYAVEQRIDNAEPDYWDYATLLELAVLAKKENEATKALFRSLAVVREVWEPETTARNLRLIDEARAKRQENIPWVKEIIKALEDVSK
ncbi:MAG: TRAFs-binding domain-containing protein [Cyanobacteria bacterium P01_F01_bin.143]